MPIEHTGRTITPHCVGQNWQVTDIDELAQLIALIMVGFAQEAAAAIDGAELNPVPVSHTLRERLRGELLLPAGADSWHRDGLLFESICWLVARQQAGPADTLADPHRKATQQGADGIKVGFDTSTRSITDVTIYEHKCSDRARRKFVKEVLPAFKTWLDGTRDDELTQVALGLLARFNLTQTEYRAAFSRLVLQRPMRFRTALTLTPSQFPDVKCKKLFKGYDAVGATETDRLGDTFCLDDLRSWFSHFAALVWAKVETIDV